MAGSRGALRSIAVALVMVLVLGVLGVALTYRRQIVSYLTHWKGPPEHTQPYEALPEADPPPLHLALAGDVGEPGSGLEGTAAAMSAVAASHPFDVLVLLGDNVYPNGDPDKLPDTVFGPFAPILDGGAELLAIVGNHDAGRALEQMEALGMPDRWWAVERGDVLIVGLDTTIPDDPEQLAWLEATLATSEATWRIVAMHHPPYSAGYQGSSHDCRDVFTPVFERHGVQLVLSGHDHDYQRSEPIAGVTYVVTGAAALTRRTGDASFTATSFATNGFVELGVYPDRIVLRSVDRDVRIADEWVLALDPRP
jgi:3',5'-cyclic AMP phosphodiesterase CpdA